MNAGLNRRGHSLPVTLGCVLMLVAMCGLPCLSQGADVACNAAMDRWSAVYQQLEHKLAEFSTLQQTRVENIVQHPLFQPTAGKTIAKQISDALQAKEELLNEIGRASCRERV